MCSSSVLSTDNVVVEFVPRSNVTTVTSYELKLLERSYVETFNNLTQRFCDPFFRVATKARVKDLRDINTLGNFPIELKVTFTCRNCDSSIRLYDISESIVFQETPDDDSGGVGDDDIVEGGGTNSTGDDDDDFIPTDDSYNSTLDDDDMYNMTSKRSLSKFNPLSVYERTKSYAASIPSFQPFRKLQEVSRRRDEAQCFCSADASAERGPSEPEFITSFVNAVQALRLPNVRSPKTCEGVDKFTTSVVTEFIGDPNSVTEAELIAFQESVIAAYQSTGEDSSTDNCDPSFRQVTDVLTELNVAFDDEFSGVLGTSAALRHRQLNRPQRVTRRHLLASTVYDSDFGRYLTVTDSNSTNATDTSNSTLAPTAAPFDTPSVPLFLLIYISGTCNGCASDSGLFDDVSGRRRMTKRDIGTSQRGGGQNGSGGGGNGSGGDQGSGSGSGGGNGKLLRWHVMSVTIRDIILTNSAHTLYSGQAKEAKPEVEVDQEVLVAAKTEVEVDQEVRVVAKTEVEVDQEVRVAAKTEVEADQEVRVAAKTEVEVLVVVKAETATEEVVQEDQDQDQGLAREARAVAVKTRKEMDADRTVANQMAETGRTKSGVSKEINRTVAAVHLVVDHPVVKMEEMMAAPMAEAAKMEVVKTRTSARKPRGLQNQQTLQERKM